MSVGDRVRDAFRAHHDLCTTLDDDTNFFEAGFNSARLVAVLGTLAESGIEVSLVDLFRFPTIGDLTVEITTRIGTPRRATPPRRGPTRMPWDS